jgi:hypothetical protein
VGIAVQQTIDVVCQVVSFFYLTKKAYVRQIVDEPRFLLGIVHLTYIRIWQQSVVVKPGWGFWSIIQYA